MGDINKALKEKFLCSAQFAQDIEAIVKDDNLGYIDAIVPVSYTHLTLPTIYSV